MLLKRALFVLMLSAPPLTALAQGGTPTSSVVSPSDKLPANPVAPPSTPASGLPDGFKPRAGAEARAESANANLLVTIAYGAFFGALFGFVIYVVRSQTALAREIADLARKLESKR